MKRFRPLTTLLPSVTRSLSYVPSSQPAKKSDIDRLQEFVNNKRRLLVITGAGLSTESGIPDYRSAGVGLYARSSRRPVQHSDFMKSPSARQLYWARNYVGWPEFASKLPNRCHHTLSQWEKQGIIRWLVTQNVDALHHKAGSSRVTELHGCTQRIKCVACDARMTRWQLQQMIEELNGSWSAPAGQMAPDGDIAIPDELVSSFKVPACPRCDGFLKPDVVFFGDNVSRDTVEFVYGEVEASDGVLVAGSSLYVYSGYRFVNHAKSHGKEVAIVNIGPTRADPITDLKVDAACGEVLPKVVLPGCNDLQPQTSQGVWGETDTWS